MKTLEEHRETLETCAQFLAWLLGKAHSDGYSFSVQITPSPFSDSKTEPRFLALVEQIIPDVTGSTTRSNEF